MIVICKQLEMRTYCWLTRPSDPMKLIESMLSDVARQTGIRLGEIMIYWRSRSDSSIATRIHINEYGTLIV